MSQRPERADEQGREKTMYVLREAEPATQADEMAVIVEIEKDGTARIRQCPPGIVVMVAHQGEITDEDDQETQPHRKRSMAAGRRNGAHSAPEPGGGSLAGVCQIPVEFPG